MHYKSDEMLKSTVELALGAISEGLNNLKSDYEVARRGDDTIEIKFEDGYSVFLKAEYTANHSSITDGPANWRAAYDQLERVWAYLDGQLDASRRLCSSIPSCYLGGYLAAQDVIVHAQSLILEGN